MKIGTSNPKFSTEKIGLNWMKHVCRIEWNVLHLSRLQCTQQTISINCEKCVSLAVFFSSLLLVEFYLTSKITKKNCEIF